MVADNRSELIRARGILQFLAGISAVGVAYWGFATLTPQRFQYEHMPFTRIAELALPYGVHYASLFLFSGGCLMARFIHYEWARNSAKHCFSGCCLITIGCVAIELAIR